MGQGLAVVVQTREHVLLFDTGASYRGGSSAAQQVVLPFLRSRGIRRIDWLIVSHADNDHAGGVRVLVDELREGRLGPVFAGESLPDILLNVADCSAGQRWTVDGIEFAVLHPEIDSRRDGNNASCVLEVRAGRHALLLTGDIEVAAERALIQRGLLRPVDVVLIPHHGSLTSSSKPFVDSTRPSLAIASAGYGNRWNFPRQRVVDRWQAAGAQVLDTATSGAISLSLCSTDGIRWLRRERQQQRRFWHDGHGRAICDDKGWVAEVEIPFKTLSFNPNNQIWGLNLIRYIGRKAEQIGWVSSNRTQNPASSGKMTGIKDIEQGLGLDVVAGFKTTRAKQDLSDETSSSTEPSLDLFYKVTPAITAALTLNTDFSGTGADERQINLTRFALFFPERRGFFLQDTDIFEFGRITGGNFSSQSTISRVELESGRPFFSRRIGLSDIGGTVDIDIGGKLTGRPGRWDIGMLAIRQNAHVGVNGDVDASDLFVARLSANVLAESSIGMILTQGDPNSNLDNTLAGVDFRYTNTRLRNGRAIEGSLWYQQSDTQVSRYSPSSPLRIRSARSR